MRGYWLDGFLGGGAACVVTPGISTEILSDTTAKLLFRMEETLQFLRNGDTGIFSDSGAAEGSIRSDPRAITFDCVSEKEQWEMVDSWPIRKLSDIRFNCSNTYDENPYCEIRFGII